jgi:hypothetical protein
MRVRRRKLCIGVYWLCLVYRFGFDGKGKNKKGKRDSFSHYKSGFINPVW